MNAATFIEAYKKSPYIHLREYAALKRFEKLLESNEAYARSYYDPGHITGSGFVLNEAKDSLLLTHHKKLGKWLQLGGHGEGEKDALEIARREVLEESGLQNVELLVDVPIDLDIHPIPERGAEAAHFHFDVRYLFKAAAGAQIQISDESSDLQWVKLDDIAGLSQEESLLRPVQKIKDWLRTL